jgi:hypothetical protein
MTTEINQHDASTCQRTPKTLGRPPEARTEHGTHSSSQLSRGINLLTHLLQIFSLKNGKAMIFSCLNPCLWCFVSAALENLHSRQSLGSRRTFELFQELVVTINLGLIKAFDGGVL